MGKYVMTAAHKAAIARGVQKYKTKCRLGKKVARIAAEASSDGAKILVMTRDGKVIVKTKKKK
jgi:hypothetical protein